MLKLLMHQWKESLRSTFWQKSIWLNIVLGIFVFYLILNLLAISFFADKIIEELLPDADVVQVFTRVLFFYFIFDLFFRFLMQPLPTLSIQPYLTLPIKKRTLLHYPLIRSITNSFNFFAILLILPFFLKVVCTVNSSVYAFAWGLSMVLFTLTNNFLNFSLKKYFSKKPLYVVLFLAVIGLLFYLELSHQLRCSTYFASAILFVTNHAYLVLVPMVMAVSTYCLGYFMLKKNAYLEETQNSQHRNTKSFSFLGKYGEVGNLLKTEIKLILRNKRSKSVLYMSIIFLCYGFIFYSPKNINQGAMLILAGVIITSMFGINYGQYFYSWEGSFFDFYLTNKVSTFNYVKSKYLLFALTSTTAYVISLLYGFVSIKLIFINFAILLYNIGVTSIVLLFFSTYNSKSIDLGKSQFMNYQGTSATQFLVVLPIMGVPLMVYLFFYVFGVSHYAFYALAFVGILGLVFSKYLLKMVADQLEERKYKLALCFRQK